MIVAVTGPRPQKMGGFQIPNPTYTKIYEALKTKIIELNPDTLISGMALGVDQIAAEICIDLKIPFIASIPFQGQESVWPPSSQNKYKEILAKAKEIKIVSEGGYSAEKMQIRNKWMVDKADLLLGVWSGKPGGTANCINYAKSIGKEIVIIGY